MAKNQKPILVEGSRLKTYADSHPLTTLVGITISAGTIVAGIMTYYTSQRLDALNDRHTGEVAELSAKAKSDLADAIYPLKQTIQDLNFRLSSIERRVPGAGPSYLDVSKITIGPEAVKDLSSSYKEFGGGFYVAVPQSSDWHFSEVTLLDFASTMFGLTDKDVGVFADVLSHAKLLRWEKNSVIKFNTSNGTLTGSKQTLTFSPTIVVQHVTSGFFKEEADAMVGMLKADEDLTKKVADASRKAADAGKLLNDLESKSNIDQRKAIASTDATENSARPEETTDETLNNVDRTKKVVEALNGAVSEDLATFALFDYLASTLNQGMNYGGHFRMFSAQKKGNIFYLQAQLEFPQAFVYDNNSPAKTAQKVVIDQEIFFVGSGADGFLIKIYLPSLPDRSESFLWTKNWLAGLQVALR